MKLSLFSFLLLFSFYPNVYAINSVLTEDKFEFGPGLSSRKSVYTDQGYTTTLVPIFVITYGDLYTEGDKAALVLGDFEWGETLFWTEAIAMYRQQGFLDATGVLNDLDDRKDAVELGAALAIASENFGILNFSLVYDVINTHKGYELALKYELPIVTGDWIIRPVLSVQKMSQNLANYYFGVDNSEVVTGRPFYHIEEATNYVLGYDLKYFLTDQWRITHSLDVTQLDQKIVDSPIVRYQTNIQVSIALVYDFF